MIDTIESASLHFARTIHDIHGDTGMIWLDRLPDLLDECAARWNLKIEPPYSLSYNYVAPAVQADGTNVVLKMSVPGDRSLVGETEALRLYDGKGMARLLDFDPQLGMALLERLEPGAPLVDLTCGPDEERATDIAASVMRAFWRPAPPNPAFPSVADWAADVEGVRKQFGGSDFVLPAVLVDRAAALFRDLLASSAPAVLLHGDLHYENILSAQREPWLAIDPKGVIGEPAYEVGALLRNPLPQLLNTDRPKQILARRLDQLAEALAIDRNRLRDWGIAQAVLSACWTVEDHGAGWESTIACAEILASL